ncbi:MAG: SDR family oxidoreductase [bacterium]|nr:SDR family oxidoreductase [bacterium]
MSKTGHIKPDFSGLSVVITGATRGIGAGIAGKLASHGAKLTRGYLKNNEPAITLQKNLSVSNPDIVLHKGDLSTPDGARAIIETARGKFGRVDVLVSNLGPFLYRSIAETSPNEWDSIVVTNLSTHFYLVKELLPEMKQRGKGNFIFIGGVGSGQVRGHRMSAAYSAAKTGLANFMKSLAAEEARNGIRSNMIAPGVIDNGEYSDGFRERIVKEIPMGYIGEPSDIANAVMWLMSDESRYVTGAVIDVSGGYHIVS